MISLQEIESAISSLSPEDRAKLFEHLPTLLPEYQGDLSWQRIISDPSPSLVLSRFVDAIDAEVRRNPETFPEITDRDFEEKPS